MKGMVAGLDLETSGRLGSVAATYALEHLGGSSHAYTFEEFAARYEESFGPLRV
jgi:adenosine kinase